MLQAIGFEAIVFEELLQVASKLQFPEQQSAFSKHIPSVALQDVKRLI